MCTLPRRQRTPFQIAELVEYELRMAAHARELAVVGGAHTISTDEDSIRIGISIGSVHKLICKSALPATQLMQF
jgi:hypothetical protein